jgi:hypothetical protein
MRKLVTAAVLVAVGASAPASAVITFTQLDEDVFVVSHRIKGIGSRGRAVKLVHEKAASLCIAAGFSHYEVLEQESQAGQEYEVANASLQVRYFFSDGKDRLDCRTGSSAEYIAQAREKLAARAYQPPTPPEEGTEAGEDPATGTCTIEQISAMVKAGLGEDQIKAACSVEG